MSPWGIPIPEQPVLAAVNGTGALTAGRYQVCYTNVVDGQIGGNGMIAEIDILCRQLFDFTSQQASRCHRMGDGPGREHLLQGGEENRL